MIGMLSNPGNGPIEGADLFHAVDNMSTFVADLRVRSRYGGVIHWTSEGIGIDRRGDDGRYGFVLRANGRRCEIDMPGLPLDRVRPVHWAEGNYNAWDYPRLFVDGNSWLWEFAVNMVVRGLALDGRA